MTLSKKRQISSLSIVVVGEFNPVIIRPFWFLSKKLIKEEEATNAKVELIHNEIVKFQIGDWMNLQVTRDRSEVRTSLEPYFEILRDLTLSICTSFSNTVSSMSRSTLMELQDGSDI